MLSRSRRCHLQALLLLLLLLVICGNPCMKPD